MNFLNNPGVSAYVSDAGGHPLVSRIANLGLVPKRIAWLT